MVSHSLHSPLEGLLARLGPSDSTEREAFELLWRQLRRHAPLFGYADHPDVDDDHLEEVQAAIHEQLVDWAQRGDLRAVEKRAVQAMFGALRSARGLATPPPSDELAALLGPANARLRAAIDCAHVPLAELFHYHRSLERHYSVHQDCFEELIGWCVMELREGSSDASRRLVAAMRSLPTPAPPSDPEAERPAAPEPMLEVFESPVSLAEFAAGAAPEFDAEPGSGHPLTQYWVAQLSAALPDLSAPPKSFPPLIEQALLVHLLGLEDRRRKAVLSSAADRLISNRLIPAAREVGAKQNRHEPIAVLMVSVLATALRPWTFVAPELTATERVILVALLGELATAKSRKLLHQEKQHADSQREPEVIRAAVNRALSRWPERVHALSPKQRMDRVAAGFRCLNRLRRGVDPRPRDLAIVHELIR